MLNKLTLPPSIRALIYFVMFISLVSGGMALERYFWKGKEAKNEVQVLKEDNAFIEKVEEEFRAKEENLKARLEKLREKFNSNDCYNTPVPSELRESQGSRQGSTTDKAIKFGKPTR